MSAESRFLLSYNDCGEIRELYDGCTFFDFKRVHSMVQKYEAGREFPELLIGNYDLFEREKARPRQLTLSEIYGETSSDYENRKESIL